MENCPMCKREFKEARDYPFINITDFERFLVPEVVFGDMGYEEFLRFNELPWIVKRRFRNDNDLRRTDYRDYVYQVKEYSDMDSLLINPKHRSYQSGKDFRKEALDALANKRLSGFLESIKENIGKTVELDEVLRRTYREDGFIGTFALVDKEKGQEVELSFDDRGVLESKGNFYIGLVGVSNLPNSNTKVSLYFKRVPLVRVGYEGRLER